MNGLALSRSFYETIGKPALEQQFPALMSRMAIGLAGEGSECLGFDDELSRDHDWGPAFCIWLEKEDYMQYGAQVQAVYDALPVEQTGYPARPYSPTSAGRVGCLCIQDWYRRYTGLEEGPVTLAQWRQIPEAFLATATNGAVFYDPLGHFSTVRERLQQFYPEDVRIKKMAARAAVMAQAGQYNFPRCVKRQDAVAAQLAKAEFTRAALSMLYLLERQYAPFYKWMFRGVKQMPKWKRTAVLLERLSTAQEEDALRLMEGICMNVAAELRRQRLTEQSGNFLLDLCPDLMAKIQDETLRKTHVMQE